MKIKVEHIIIVALLALLWLRGCNGETSPVVEQTTVNEKTITETDSTSNSSIKNQVPEKVAIIENEKSVTEVDKDTLPETEKRKVKQVSRYRDTTRFEHATIYSDILSEGRILQYDVKADIGHLERTITTTKTIVKQPGGLFLSPGLHYSPLGGLQSLEAGLTFIKGNFGVSAGGYWNFKQSTPGLSFKAHIKL